MVDASPIRCAEDARATTVAVVLFVGHRGDRTVTDARDPAESGTRQTPAVAVVGAETPGNVGTIARSMKNFGFETLLLVDPPTLDPDGEAYGYAGQAREDVLPEATEITFEHLVSEYHTIGCTAVPNEDDRSHVRYPFSTPTDLAGRLPTADAATALVFGRERVGLHNDELERLDEICAIPANPDYPVLNLGQAATITLYELRTLALETNQLPDIERTRAPEPAIERCVDHWAALLEAINHPSEKRPKATRMVRRLLGRADPTEREIQTLTGVLRRAAERPDLASTDRDGDS